MKKIGLIISLLLVVCSCKNNESSFNNTNTNNISESSIKESIFQSSSEVVDYGNVTFDNIYVFSNGYDGVKIRPFFSNIEMEEKVNFSYIIEDESICEIDEYNKVWFKNVGSTKVTAISEYYDELSFYVNCEEEMMPSGVFANAKNMTKSIYNNYQDNETLFVGDSFFQFWREGTTGVKTFAKTFEGYKVFNIGMNSATTHDLRAMIENTITFTNPKNIVVNIGVNNVDDDGETGLKCFRNIKALLDDYLECFPNVEVYYLSITQCTGVFASKWVFHSTSNNEVKKYCESQERLHYLDVNELYGDTPAIYQSDGLHPNQSGYDLFEKIIKENVDLEME